MEGLRKNFFFSTLFRASTIIGKNLIINSTFILWWKNLCVYHRVSQLTVAQHRGDWVPVTYGAEVFIRQIQWSLRKWLLPAKYRKPPAVRYPKGCHVVIWKLSDISISVRIYWRYWDITGNKPEDGGFRSIRNSTMPYTIMVTIIFLNWYCRRIIFRCRQPWT